MKLLKLLTNILTMIYNDTEQYMLFTIHFIGSNYINFLARLPKIYNKHKGSKFYYIFVKDFIHKNIYTIFGKEIIGEINYERISVIEYYLLRKDVPLLEEIFKPKLQNASRNVTKNHIFTSKLNT